MVAAVVGVISAASAAAATAQRKGKAPKPAPLPELNQKVVEYARGQLGKKVANGECTSLAVEALRTAGARRFGWERSGDFVWGRPVESFADALPGDILQFRDAVFQGKRMLPGQRLQSWRQEYAHHTAVVDQVRERDGEVVVLHQNVGKPGAEEAKKRLVKRDAIRPASLQPGGRVWIYRPVAHDQEVAERAREGRPDPTTTSRGVNPCSGTP
ncbi:MAG: hypothetical protein U0835_19300 [Isosphaeraceae bacterium]